MTINVRQEGPSGGGGGKPFWIMPPTSDFGLVVWSGDYIDSLVIYYDHVRTRGVLAAGGLGGSAVWVPPTKKYMNGDYIRAIYGRSGDFVDQLTFVLNSGATFTHGGNGGGNNFEYVAENGEEIIGFFGRAGDYIDSIGVIIARRAELPLVASHA